MLPTHTLTRMRSGLRTSSIYRFLHFRGAHQRTRRRSVSRRAQRAPSPQYIFYP